MAESGNEVRYLDHGGVQRRYVLYRPRSLTRPAPVVVMLDGRGGTPWTAMKITGWSRLAEEQGFLVVYPEAMRLHPDQPMHYLTNPQMWDAGSGGSDTDRSPVDDTGFLRAILDDLPAQERIDPRQVYLTGFSNGASMVFRYAVTHPETLAAIAPVSGHFRVPIKQPIPPLPCLMFFGRLDPLSPCEGGEVSLPWGVREHRPSVAHSFQSWLKACGLQPETIQSRHEEGLECFEAGTSRLVIIEDLAHVWPGGHRLLPESIVGPGSNRIDGTREIWAFFRRFQRPVG
ncbi:MAG: hypothetical protein KDL31_00610 [Kiritimatiellae bacterium]|nr:hypothetical protein [Kiritimatiellia bacterium]